MGLETGVLDPEHLRYVRAVDVEVDESRVIPAVGEGVSEIRRDRALPDTALPGEDEDDVLDVDVCLRGEPLWSVGVSRIVTFGSRWAARAVPGAGFFIWFVRLSHEKYPLEYTILQEKDLELLYINGK